GATRKSTHKSWKRLQLEELENRLTPSTFIPVSDARDLVFDATRNQLLISTASGKLQRFDVAGKTLLTPYNVGTTLNGADITADGQYVYVAETKPTGTFGVLYKVRVSDGLKQTIF